MTPERIKEIQQETAYPDSISVQQALLKVWNECKQERVKNCNTPSVTHRFCVGDIVELIHHISDGYTEIGDYNVVFPPPTLVKIIEVREGWLKYGVKVLKETELPKKLQGTQFRTAMANHANNGKIAFIGNKQSFFDGDSSIDDKYFEKTYYQPESYLRAVANGG